MISFQGDVSLKNRLNPDLGHLIYIMNSYPLLKIKIDEMIDEVIACNVYTYVVGIYASTTDPPRLRTTHG